MKLTVVKGTLPLTLRSPRNPGPTLLREMLFFKVYNRHTNFGALIQ